MGSSIFRSLALFSLSCCLGTNVIDLMRFTAWEDSHDFLVPVLVLAGLAIAFGIGYVAKYILRRK